MDRTAAFYSQPTYVQRGGGLPIYSGSRRQRGGNVFGALKSFFMPLLGNVKRTAVRHVKRQALGLAKDLARDAFSGRNIGESLKQRGIQRVKQLGKDVLHDTVMTPTTRKAATNKRKAAANTVKRPVRKRRRVGRNF